MVTHARAYAHTNIALIKYWGKRRDDGKSRNLPAVGSLSLTLREYGTETEIEEHESDLFVLNDAVVGSADAKRVFDFLSLCEPKRAPVKVTSRNDVPTASGLASSASAFAALAVCASRAFALNLDDKALSILARRGSGSAARSIFGGLVRMHKGSRDDGDDCYAEPIANTLDLRLVVVRCSDKKKDIASTFGMNHSETTSPYFKTWVDTHPHDLAEAEAAIATGDIERLGRAMEMSTMKMHATTMTAAPPFYYLNPTSWKVIHAVADLRARGTLAFTTMDAGPHVKVLTTPMDAERVRASLSAIDGVFSVDIATPGPAAHLLDGAK